MRILGTSTRTAAVAVAAGLITVTMTSAAAAGIPSSHHPRDPKPTVVLVHGAWADGSSWAAVTEKLQHQGYRVDVPPNPLRGVASDAAYLAAYLGTISGPIVLVGHSYGGMVITAAATGNANVEALVYIDAFIPDTGDSAGSLTAAEPGSALLVADPSTVFNAVPIPDGGGNVDLYVQQALFPAMFVAGAPHRQAAVLAAGQRPLAASALDEKLATLPAWQNIPSWALVGTADQVIPSAEQVVMATRAGAHTVKAEAPHLSMVTQPDAVTDLITEAAAHS
jgi:pimeloyl-ACP methyl ester carboxylesterase